MAGGEFLDAASQEASDDEGEDEDEEEYETMTMTEAGDVGEAAVEQVRSPLFRTSNTM
jgi:hypothetical protein